MLTWAVICGFQHELTHKGHEIWHPLPGEPSAPTSPCPDKNCLTQFLMELTSAHIRNRTQIQKTGEKSCVWWEILCRLVDNV